MATWRSTDQTCWNTVEVTTQWVHVYWVLMLWIDGIVKSHQVLCWSLAQCGLSLSILLPFCLFLFASANLSYFLSFQFFLYLSVNMSLSSVVNEICWTAEFSKGLCLENERSCVASVGSSPALVQFVCCVYLSQMQPFLHWRLCHAVHTLTLLPPTEISPGRSL